MRLRGSAVTDKPMGDDRFSGSVWRPTAVGWRSSTSMRSTSGIRAPGSDGRRPLSAAAGFGTWLQLLAASGWLPAELNVTSNCGTRTPEHAWRRYTVQTEL